MARKSSYAPVNGLIYPKRSDGFLDSVAINTSPTNVDYRKASNPYTVWGPQARDLRLRAIRYSFGFDWPCATWNGGGGGQTYDRTAHVAMLTYLSNLGLGISLPTWGSTSGTVDTYGELISGAYDAVNFIAFEGDNEPPAFIGSYPLEVPRSADGRNRGSWSNATSYTAGDYVNNSGYIYRCMSTHISSANGPTAVWSFGSNLWLPLWMANLDYFDKTMIPAIRARWPRATFVNASSFYDMDSAFPTFTAGSLSGTKPSVAFGVARNLAAYNGHDYALPGGAYDMPNGNIDSNAIAGSQGRSAILRNSRAVWITETCAHRNGPIGGPGDGHGYSITQQGASTLYIRTLLWSYWSGIEKCIPWDLCDQPDAWYNGSGNDVQQWAGIINSDGTYKPSATALKYVNTLLEDTTTPVFTVAPFAATWSGATPPDLAAVWLQKADGTLTLATWLRRQVTTDPTGSSATARGGATSGDVKCSAGLFASGTYVASSAAASVTFAARSFSAVRQHSTTALVVTLPAVTAGVAFTFTATETPQFFQFIP